MAGFGDTLGSFPELFTNIHFWESKPKAGGGYSIGEETDVTGILLNSAPGASIFKRNYGGDYGLDASSEDLLWVQADTPVRLGMFFYHPQDGSVCRVIKQYDKSVAGGYKRFVTERVNGSNGTNEKDVPVSNGVYL